MHQRNRAPRNRTLTLTASDRTRLRPLIAQPEDIARAFDQLVLVGDSLELAQCVQPRSIDLLLLDPPYNLDKNFHGNKFSKQSTGNYADWLSRVLETLEPLLKRTATVYVCGDWHTSGSIYPVVSKYFKVRNRITWEREKGRGAHANWKNSSEDIWFCTVSDDYFFDVEAVKVRRRVIAPYKTEDGKAKDWIETADGGFRDTHPSNLWTDITIPFWSMPENTDHPTQKSEKLLAKLLLASTRENEVILDPFLGSGTTAVVARKLRRRCIGIELNEEYALWALRRLEMASGDQTIQGYCDGVFWDRNTLAQQQMKSKTPAKRDGIEALFPS